MDFTVYNFHLQVIFFISLLFLQVMFFVVLPFYMLNDANFTDLLVV